MLNRLLPSARHPQQWFARARLIAFATAALMAVLVLGVMLAANWNVISARNATFAIFSLLPLVAVVAVQVLSRLQEVVTMQAGGMAIDLGDESD